MLSLLGKQVCHDLPTVWRVAMFEKVNALPSAKGHFSTIYRDVDRHRHHGRLDMGGHVVWPFVGVGQIGHRGIRRWRHQAVKKGLKVCLYFRVGIFLNKQAS